MGIMNCNKPIVTDRRKSLPGCLYARGKQGRWWWRVKLPGSRVHKNTGLRRKEARLATTSRSLAVDLAWEMWNQAEAELRPENVGPDPTVRDIVSAYRAHAKRRYRDEDGTETGEVKKINWAEGPLLDLFGNKPADDFGPRSLRRVQEKMIELGLHLTTINSRIALIRRMFKWAGSEGLIDRGVYYGLLTVEGLTAGRYGLSAPVTFKAVGGRDRGLAMRYMPRCLRAIVEVQRLIAGCPQDMCNMRPMDIDRSDAVWVYRPAKHKNKYRGHVREVAIGPRGQRVLAPYLDACKKPDEHVFSPAKTQAERYAAIRAKRKSPVQPSQRDRSKPDSRKKPRDRYDTPAYGKRIAAAIKLARRDWPEIKDWTPNMLRHAGSDAARDAMGLDAAQAMLGQRHASTTEIYAQVRLQKAKKVARNLW